MAPVHSTIGDQGALSWALLCPILAGPPNPAINQSARHPRRRFPPTSACPKRDLIALLAQGMPEAHTVVMSMRTPRQPAIEWDQIGQPLFDRIIEALVEHLYDNSWDVRPIDGRGGDGGIDIECQHKETGARHVFQLKYFPEGFTGTHKKRQKQISESYEKLEDLPDKWILVAPCTTSHHGYAFLQTVAKPPVKLEFWHRARLDHLLSQHPTLRNHFAREDYALEQAKQMGTEQSLLTHGSSDLAQRLRSLGETVDSVDKDWTFDFIRRGETVVNVLRPQHPRAAEVSPIRISLRVDETALTEGSRAMFRNMRYGLAGLLEIPESALREVHIDGPELVRCKDTSGVHIIWSQTANHQIAGRPVELRTRDACGAVTGTFHGSITDGRPGPAGASLRVTFEDVLILTLLMPHAPTQGEGSPSEGTVDLAQEHPESISVDRARAATELLLNLSRGDQAELFSEGTNFATFTVTPGTLVAAEQEEQLSVLEDLDVVQRAAKNRFPVPSRVTGRERTWLRALRLAMEHGHTYAPGVRGIYGVAQPSALESTATKDLFQGAPTSGIQTLNPFTLEMAGRSLTFDSLAFYHPALVLQEAERVRADLEAGRETPFELLTADGSLMSIIGPAYPDAGIAPIPWNLPGV